MSLFGFLAFILGPAMKILYDFINNYAVTIIVFTVLIRLVSFPLAISQQKSMAKMSVLTPMMNEIQTKYKNNQQKQQEELARLQQEYGFNPTAGCLPMLLNMMVLFGVIEVVYRPLKYILGFTDEVIAVASESLGLNAANYISQTKIIQAIHNGEAVSGLSAEQIASVQNFNTTFLGLDICGMVEKSLNPMLIFPLLAVGTMIVSQMVMNKMNGTQSQQQGSMKAMLWFTNIFFAYFCFTVPIGFSVYYITSNVCMLVQSLVVGKVYSPEKYKVQYEAEVAAKRAERKKKKEVTVEVNGKQVSKEVGLADYNKLRLERARKLDEEYYKDERTTRLDGKAAPADLNKEDK